MLNAPSVLALDAVEVLNGKDLGNDMKDPLTEMLMGVVTDKFGLSQEAIQEQAANANVYASKQDSPSIVVTFDNNKPKLGDKVTATAAPINFANTSNSHMYFTWFIKHKACYVNENTRMANKDDEKICDADYDGKITVNDWKVEAMRTIASNGFDWKNKSYAKKNEEYNRNDFETDAEKGIYYNDDKGYGDCGDDKNCPGDAFFAPFGGTDNESTMFSKGSSFLENLTEQQKNIASAIDLIKQIDNDTLIYDGPLNTGDTNPSDDCLGIGVTGLDPILVAPEDNCSGKDIDGDALDWDEMTTLEQIQTRHEVILDILNYNNIDNPTEIFLNVLGSVDWGELASFINSGPEEMTQKIIEYLENSIAQAYDTAVDNRPRCYITNPKTGKTFEMVDGTENEVINNLSDELPIPSSLEDIAKFFLFPGCKHYFPYMPKNVTIPLLDITVNSNRPRLFGLPDFYDSDGIRILSRYDYKYSLKTGKIEKRAFDFEAEKFWSTNPEDPSTAKNGNVDEANVIGLGQDTFTWEYQPGDEIGVIVEGIGNYETKYYDAIKPTTWALTKNLCPNGIINSWTTDTRKVWARGKLITIPTVKDVNLNECIPYNLISPNESRDSEQLEVNLSYAPENPINDAAEGSLTGDDLQIKATVSNAKNSNHLKYYWDITYSEDFGGKNYYPIQCLYRSTNPNQKAFYDSIRPTQYSGIKLDTMKLNLNIKHGTVGGYTECPAEMLEPKYIKADVTVVENIPTALTSLIGTKGITINEGKASITIPILSIKEKIRVYNANTTSEENTTLIFDKDKDEICNSKTMNQEDACWKLENETLPTNPDDISALISD